MSKYRFYIKNMLRGKYKRTKKHKKDASKRMKMNGNLFGFKKGHKYYGGPGNENANWKGGVTENLKEYMKKYHKDWDKKRQEKIAGREKSEQCEICEVVIKSNKRGKAICFDHDHKTGKFRGWICFRCNVVLGFVNDDIDLLTTMINYLNLSK